MEGGGPSQSSPPSPRAVFLWRLYPILLIPVLSDDMAPASIAAPQTSHTQSNHTAAPANPTAVIPTTLGNWVGGAVCVGTVYSFACEYCVLCNQCISVWHMCSVCSALMSGVRRLRQPFACECTSSSALPRKRASFAKGVAAVLHVIVCVCMCI